MEGRRRKIAYVGVVASCALLAVWFVVRQPAGPEAINILPAGEQKRDLEHGEDGERDINADLEHREESFLSAMPPSVKKRESLAAETLQDLYSRIADSNDPIQRRELRYRIIDLEPRRETFWFMIQHLEERRRDPEC
jgi:hypothetical protein